MRPWIFWTVATLVLATIAHLSVVLFAPMIDVGRRMAAFETAAPVNTLRKLPPAGPGASILVEQSPDISYAFCRFDISRQPLKVSAPVPDSYWSLNIYSDTGENLQTFSNSRLRVRQLDLVILDETKVTGESGTIVDLPEEAISYTSPVAHGLIVLRAYVPDRSQRKLIDSTVASATCSPLGSS